MDRPNFYSLKPNLIHQNVSAAIGRPNYKVGGQGEEQGASCGEKKPGDWAAVEDKGPEHINQSHLKIWDKR